MTLFFVLVLFRNLVINNFLRLKNIYAYTPLSLSICVL